MGGDIKETAVTVEELGDNNEGIEYSLLDREGDITVIEDDVDLNGFNTHASPPEDKGRICLTENRSVLDV